MKIQISVINSESTTDVLIGQIIFSDYNGKISSESKLIQVNHLTTHPLLTTLKNLRGNPRACVYTEPLWGIPYNLYIPYASVYMVALGLNDRQIGLIISIGFGVQVFSALISGALTDRIGRRRTTFIFDTLSWSVPCIIWAVAQNFTYFVVAALFNGMWRVTLNSWSCLLVEDADPEQLVEVYAWIYISGMMAAFFTPIAGILINAFSLVPTMRGLYLFAFVLMTAKFIILNSYATETRQGVIRMEETKDQSLLSILRDYPAVIGQILKTPGTLFTLGIMLVVTICSMISGSFWAILVTERLQIPAQNIAIFPFVKSVVMLLFFFFVLPWIRKFDFRRVMISGFLGYIASQLILINTPPGGYALLLVSAFLEACSYAALSPQLDRLVAVTVDPQERARIYAILYVVVIVCTAPFGWIAGNLSSLNKIYPFVLSLSLFAVGGLLVYLSARMRWTEASASGV